MSVSRGTPPGIPTQAAQSQDVLRRVAALERASSSGGGGGGGGAAGFTYVQAAPPTPPITLNSTWFDTDTGFSYVWYDGFWVQFAPGGGGGLEVVDSGSSANGTWLRYSDGTQITYTELTLSDVAINVAYGTGFTGTRAILFPQTFITPPVVTVGKARWGSSASWGFVQTTSTSTVTIQLLDFFSRATGTATVFMFTAIGRWY